MIAAEKAALTAGGQVLTLGAGDDLFAVPVARVQEILDLQPISRLPNAPPHVLGVIDVRGEGVAVVDLRRLLGLSPVEETDATRIIVLWILNAGARSIVALKADRVLEVTSLDAGDLTPLPQARLLRWDQQMVAGLGRIGGQFVTALDLDRMFDTDMLKTMESMDIAQSSPSPARDIA